MTIRIACPKCERKLKIPEAQIGKSTKCPACNAVFRAEAPAANEDDDNEAQQEKVAAKPPASMSPKKRPEVEQIADDDPDSRESEPSDKAEKKGKKKSGCGTVLLVLASVGLLLIAVTGGLGFWFWTELRAAFSGSPAGPGTRLSQGPPGSTGPAGGQNKGIDAEIEQAGAGEKLVPYDVTLSGVTITLLAPEGAEVIKDDKRRTTYIYKKRAAGNPFNLLIAPGFIDLPTAKERWKTRTYEQTIALPIDTPDLVLREFTVIKDALHPGPQFRFAKNASFGYLDVHFTNELDTRADCLLMIKCARSAAVKGTPSTPSTLADLEKCGVRFSKSDDGKVTDVIFGAQPFTDKMLAALAPLLPDLETLNLSQTDVSDDGLRHVAGMKKLTFLALPYRDGVVGSETDSALNGSGFVHLSQLVELTSLQNGNALVTDDALKHLAGLKKLGDLTLYGSPITDSGLESLKTLPALRRVDARKTKVTEAGVENLKKALPEVRVTIDAK